MFFLVIPKYGTWPNIVIQSQTWLETADMCTGARMTLPIPRSEAEVSAICASVHDKIRLLAFPPPRILIWTGIITGAQPNSFVNYMDQSAVRAPYGIARTYGHWSSNDCISLICTETGYGYTISDCTSNSTPDDQFNFCEDPCKYPFENLILYEEKLIYFDV